MKFQIGTQFYWALNQLTKKPKSLQRTSRPAKQLKAEQKSKVDVTHGQKPKKSQLANGSDRKTTSAVADIPSTPSEKKTNPPSKQVGQKCKTDPNETAKSPPTKKRKADESQRNKKSPTARKGWKGYVEMSREEFERDLALKEKEDYKALPHKWG